MLKNISVVGGGTMGHTIALTFLMHGFSVQLCEPVDAVRADAPHRIGSALTQLVGAGVVPPARVGESLARLSLHAQLAPAVQNADYVIEAVPEKLALKQSLFEQLDALCPPHAILASNTSSLKLDDMAARVSGMRRAKMMICHWYNPGHLIPVAELSAFGNMSEQDFEAVYALYVAVGKQPVKVLRDIPGLVANRLLHAMVREAMHLAETGVAAPEDIDRALRYGPGFRGAVAGPFEQADLGGLDVWCAAEDNFLPHLDTAAKASPLLREKVEAGKLGVKTGEGFYEYPRPQQAVESFNERLLRQYLLNKER